MGFRINTNIAAMNSHRNATQTNMGLDKSLASLSSGLRINTAADDASGMVIADSLRSQAQGLGQAINNANDGVAVVQTADGALDEYINIINTVRTKAIQAASDGQNTDSRAAIQADIDRLLEAANGIATQTQFNGQKLLDGTFTNKSFHIGAYAAETASLSVDSVKTDSVGDIKSVTGASTRSVLDSTNTTETSAGYALNSEALTVNDIDITTSLNLNSPNSLMDAKNIAAAITDATGMLAQGTTVIDGSTIIGGTIDSNTALEINGIAIADTTVVAGDANGALTRAINDISDQTGVTAALANGALTLTSDDGSNISVGGTSQAQVETLILTGTMEIGDKYTSTINGTAVSYTTVATDLDLDDVAAGLATAINQNASAGALVTATASTDGSGKVTMTAIDDSTATAFTVVGGTGTNRSDETPAMTTNVDQAGVAALKETFDMTFTTASTDADVITFDGVVVTMAADATPTVTEAAADYIAKYNADGAANYVATVAAGVVTFTAKLAGDVSPNNTVADVSIVSGGAAADAVVTVSAPSQEGTDGTQKIETVSVTAPTAPATTYNIGDTFTLDLDGANQISYAAVLGDTEVEIAAGLKAAYDAVAALTAQATVVDNGDGSLTFSEVAVAGIYDGGDTINLSPADVNAAPTNDQLITVSTAVGEQIAASDVTAYSITGLSDKLTDQVGTAAVVGLEENNTAVFTIAQGELIINGQDMAATYGDSVTAGSAADKLMEAIQKIDGMEDSKMQNGALKLVVNNGNDLNIAGSDVATYNLTAGITNESQTGTVDIFSGDAAVKIGGGDPDALGFSAGTFASRNNDVSLEDINVTNRDSAEVAILIADSALKQLDATRADLGSVQNQLESTIRNISVTQVNVTAAESQIRDVDFAAESANFAKLNILAQSGSYAMSQANAVQQNVMRLLQ